MDSKIFLRKIEPRDKIFLLELYARSREEEFEQSFLTKAQKKAFLRDQYRLQDNHYRTVWPDGHFQIIMIGSTPIGKLIWSVAENHLRLIDLCLLPDFQRRGIGTYLIQVLQGKAENSSLPLRLSVMQSNAGAIRLYRSLAFRRIGILDGYFEFEWVAETAYLSGGEKPK